MKIADIRKLSTAELTLETTKLRDEIADLRRHIYMGDNQNLRAVRNKRTHAVNRAELLIPGPRTIDGIERLANIFHPPTATQ